MDTLGTIVPHLSEAATSDSRVEAQERLRFLAHTGGRGLLTGASGTGKSWLLSELAGQLRREGLAVAEIDMTAVDSREFPGLVASRLGLGVAVGMDSIELWSVLQDHAESSRRMGRRMSFVLDHADRADGSVWNALLRLMEQYGPSCAWLLACRTPADSVADQPGWSVLRDQAWLRIELPKLERRDASQLLSRDLAKRGNSTSISPAAIDAALEITGGEARCMKQLSQLAGLAMESDEIRELDEAVILELAKELLR